MTAPKKIPRGVIPTVEDFRLTDQQRNFHDAYTSGPTRMNAMASAVAAGYSDSTARTVSSRWTPSSGHTSESIRSCKPIVQAIFFTLHREQQIRNEVTARQTERTIERKLVTKEYIENSLLELAERCMGKDKSKNFQIAAECIDEALGADKIDAALRQRLIESFVRHANKHRVFHPAGAKEALKLLGIEAGMFMKIIKNAPQTPVDAMTLEQLEAEKTSLESQYSQITAAVTKKSNGGSRAKPS